MSCNKTTCKDVRDLAYKIANKRTRKIIAFKMALEALRKLLKKSAVKEPSK